MKFLADLENLYDVFAVFFIIVRVKTRVFKPVLMTINK